MAISTKTSSRSGALSALWAMLDAPDQGEPSPAPTQVMVGARLAGLSSVGACKLLMRGISSQVIGPLGDYLGLGKGVVAKAKARTKWFMQHPTAPCANWKSAPTVMGPTRKIRP